MILVQRKVHGKHRYLQCDAPACKRSARWDAELLPGHRVPLCTACAEVWREAYDNALCNWELEAHDAAEDFRSVA